MKEKFRRSPVIQRLMGSLLVVKLEILVNPFPGLTGRIILIEIDFLIFEASPEAFGKNVVDGPAFSVHGHLNVLRGESLQIA